MRYRVIEKFGKKFRIKKERREKKNRRPKKKKKKKLEKDENYNKKQKVSNRLKKRVQRGRIERVRMQKTKRNICMSEHKLRRKLKLKNFENRNDTGKQETLFLVLHVRRCVRTCVRTCVRACICECCVCMCVRARV